MTDSSPLFVLNMDLEHLSHILLMAEILHQFICSLSHYLEGFIHPRWCRISAINSTIIFHGARQTSVVWCDFSARCQGEWKDPNRRRAAKEKKEEEAKKQLEEDMSSMVVSGSPKRWVAFSTHLLF